MKLSFAWLHKNSVNRKLLLLVLGTCCVSMLVAGVTLFTYLTFAQRTSFQNDIEALAEIMAANCSGPVAFGDREAATELMASLRAKEQIIGASIRLPNGDLFAHTGRMDLSLAKGHDWTGGEWREENSFVQSTPIILRDEKIGTLHLTSDFGPIYEQFFRTYTLVFTLTFSGAVWVGLLLATRARRSITDPIHSLADSVREIESSETPVERLAHRPGGGEMERIADAFNVMADRVKASAELAREVAERRRVEAALRESEERFRSLFENAPIGLYRSRRDGAFLMANPALLHMLGYSTFEELAAGYDSFQVGVLPNYREHFRECLEQLGLVGETEVQWRCADGRVITVRESAKAIRDKAGNILYFEGCVEDISARKEAEAELQRLNRELVEASRTAGMAEVATGVLHNVGNVLNSVSVSTQLLHEEVGRSKFSNLRQAVGMLNENLPQLASYLAADPKGKLLPEYLVKVTDHVAGEHSRWHNELKQLKENIEHMKEVVAMQQGYARLTSFAEPLEASALVEDALRINLAGLQRHKVTVRRDFSTVPHVFADKHKVLQILINLIRNAKYALDEGPGPEKLMDLKIYKNGSGMVKIVVKDNGVGIFKENLTRIFAHGFTTRRNGHGFGLHSGAIAAKELGGTLTAESEGPGTGATFTLELPVAGPRN